MNFLPRQLCYLIKFYLHVLVYFTNQCHTFFFLYKFKMCMTNIFYRTCWFCSFYWIVVNFHQWNNRVLIMYLLTVCPRYIHVACLWHREQLPSISKCDTHTALLVFGCHFPQTLSPVRDLFYIHMYIESTWCWWIT